VIEIEPMGNMPVIKDLIVDMDAVHWKKIQQITPWLLPVEPAPEREYIVDRESMVDVTQTMACIQCGACVSDCLAMEVDPLFVGPAAMAKSYRFVGDPRDDKHEARLNHLAQDPHGLYDCTHCFKCVEACPKGVNPMGQIMRLRRIATGDFHIKDDNNGERHEQAFASLVKENGLLWEAELLPRSYGGNSWWGKFAPAAGKELLSSLPVILKSVMRGKVGIGGALKPHKIPAQDLKQVQAIYETVEGRDERYELNLYIAGEDEPRPRPPPSAARIARRHHEGRLLARLCEPRLHPRAARLDGQGCAAARHRARRTGPRCCTGAGVIAEHNQELADTLNARTFALAQQVDGAEMMMNICSTCQGAQSEAQERLDANAEYRAHVNETLSAEGLEYMQGCTNKNFLWLLVEEIGLDALSSKVKRPLTNLRVGPFYGCYIVRPTDRLGIDEEHRATTTCSR